MKVLHIASLGSVFATRAYFSWLEANFDVSDHTLVSLPNTQWPELKGFERVESSDDLEYIINLSQQSALADRVFIHGLFGWPLAAVFSFSPWLWAKTFWLIWGADLYHHNLTGRDGLRNVAGRLLRLPASKYLGNLVTYVDGDVENLRAWFGSTGRYHECLLYPGNTFSCADLSPRPPGQTLHIQLGNSADPTNHHFEMLEVLSYYRNRPLRITTPLSYGNERYARSVAEVGNRTFGDKFHAMTDKMPLADYRAFQADIDIAIFAHRRQQGMGNIINLLGLGKTIYLRSDTTTWELLQRLGFHVRDVDKFELSVLPAKDASANHQLALEVFSPARLKAQWARLFSKDL